MRMKRETAKEYAYIALPYLVQRANQGRPIYYGELGDKIGLNAQGLGDTLDHIRDQVCEPRGLPHLNIIVIRNDSTQRPPDEVIEKSGRLPGESHQAAFERLKQRVFDYNDWDRLLADLNLPTAGEKQQ